MISKEFDDLFQCGYKFIIMLLCNDNVNIHAALN